MCTVSLMMEAGRNIPPSQWDSSSFFQFQEIIQRLEQLDKKLGQPDCHDPAKAAWMKEVEDRLSRLEPKCTVSYDKPVVSDEAAFRKKLVADIEGYLQSFKRQKADEFTLEQIMEIMKIDKAVSVNPIYPGLLSLEVEDLEEYLDELKAIATRMALRDSHD